MKYETLKLNQDVLWEFDKFVLNFKISHNKNIRTAD